MSGCRGVHNAHEMRPSVSVAVACTLLRAGVADGVGGWRSYGIDPSRFSSTLMSTCARLVQEGRVTAAQPAAVLAAAYYEILDSKASLIGSCTACIVSLNRADRTLYSATLGDSGFLVLRAIPPGPSLVPGAGAQLGSTNVLHGLAAAETAQREAAEPSAAPQPLLRVVHRSRKMQHYFNAPHQLAVEPPEQRGLVISDRYLTLILTLLVSDYCSFPRTCIALDCTYGLTVQSLRLTVQCWQ